MASHATKQKILSPCPAALSPLWHPRAKGPLVSGSLGGWEHHLSPCMGTSPPSGVGLHRSSVSKREEPASFIFLIATQVRGEGAMKYRSFQIPLQKFGMVCRTLKIGSSSDRLECGVLVMHNAWWATNVRICPCLEVLVNSWLFFLQVLI